MEAKDGRFVGEKVMDYIESLKQDAAKLRIVRACNTCRHRPRDLKFGTCRATGQWLSWDREQPNGVCGLDGKFWEQAPRTFWQRLGDAIIERVKPSRMDETR